MSAASDQEHRQHFSDATKYEKELAESEEIFKLSASPVACHVLSLCCGNAIGMERLRTYLPLAEVTGVDVCKYQVAAFYESQQLFTFLQTDIFSSDERLIAQCRQADIWYGIHACRELAHRIIELFNQFAPEGAKLFLMPCCYFSKAFVRQAVGHDLFYAMQIEERAKIQGRQAFMQPLMRRARNHVLSGLSPFFIRIERCESIASPQNEVLCYHKL